MSPSELRALADKLEEESKVVKIGYLKYDLYDYKPYNWDDRSPKSRYHCHYYTKGDRKRFLKTVSERFKLFLKKGTKIFCRLIDGRESWGNEDGKFVEYMSAEAANVYLENIQDAEPRNE